MTNPYWHKISRIAYQQRLRGTAEYGQGIEANPAEIVDRLNMLQEELIDALYYIEWAKDKLGGENG